MAVLLENISAYCVKIIIKINMDLLLPAVCLKFFDLALRYVVSKNEERSRQ